MKKFILSLLATISVLAGLAQNIPGRYITIESAPTLTSPQTITQAITSPGGMYFAGGAYYQSLWACCAGQSKDGILSGPFVDGFQINFDTQGRFVNADSTTKMGANTKADHAMATISPSNNIFIYGKSPTAPIIFYSKYTTPTTGFNGVQFISLTNGFSGGVQNAVGKYLGSSMATANNSSGTRYYEKLTFRFMRSFGVMQEGIVYIGTTHSPFDPINSLTVEHNYSWQSCREGIQVEGVNYAIIRNNTIYRAGNNTNGVCGGSGQDNALQLQGNGKVLVYHNLFVDTARPFNLFQHNGRIKENYFEFNSAEGFIGDYRTPGNFFDPANCSCDNPNFNVQDTLVIEGNYFKYTGGGSIAVLTVISDKRATIIFRNNKFENITAIWSGTYSNVGQPAGSGSVIGTTTTNGNTSVTSGTIPTPVFQDYNCSGCYDTQGLLSINDTFWYPKHYGYRTP